MIDKLSDLVLDPRNARQHTARNVGMLEKALNEVGASRSIVIDENGVVLAGNATVEAAALAGIEKVQVVDADGETIIAVRRTGLSANQKTRLALYDNRTAELAEWDKQVLAEIAVAERQMLDGLFYDSELDQIVEGLLASEDDDLGDDSQTTGIFTRRHYLFIAQVIDEMLSVAGTLKEQRNNTAAAFADALARDSAKFDAERFIKLCTASLEIL